MAWEIYDGKALRSDEKTKEVEAMIAALEKADPGSGAYSTLSRTTILARTDRLIVKAVNKDYAPDQRWNSKCTLKISREEGKP